MAIFLASTKSISRGSGQSAVASASYRSGEVLKDERYGKTHDYSKRSGVMSADIILPSALADAGVTIDRSDLWNKAESAEKRKDARVAREWLINLPHELSEQDRKDIAHRFAQTLADRYDTIADCAIHKPTQREIDRGADPRNFHAHIMFTTRKAVIGNNNEIILTDKADIELSDTKRRQLNFEIERVNDELKEIRQLWEQIANKKLAEHEHDLIDCRSYADQGLDIEPQLKMGSVATKLERDAYEKAKKEAVDNEQEFTGIAPVTIRGEINAMIAERNSLVLEASNKIIFESRERHERISRKIRESSDRIRNTESVIDRTQRIIDENTERARDAESAIGWTTKRCENLPNRISEIADGIAWAAKRCEKLPEVVGDITNKHEKILSATRRTVSGNEEAASICESLSNLIEKNTDNIRDTESTIKRVSREIAERTKPAPNPFDNEYERAFYERKRRIDRATREADRKLDGSKFGDVQRSNDVKNAAQTLAYRLLNRRREGLFDDRQLTVLDSFTENLGIDENQGSDFRHNVRFATDKINTVEVLEHNPQVLYLLNFPSQEREHHTTLTADFYRFIAHIDKQRAERTREYQAKLGRSDTSRVTAEILTAKPYLSALTKYASNSEKTDESRALAEQHINKTLRLTVKQYEIAYNGLNTLSSTDSVQKHVRELEYSWGRFATDYSKKLTEVDLRSINDCLKVTDKGTKINNANDGYTSPGF